MGLYIAYRNVGPKTLNQTRVIFECFFFSLLLNLSLTILKYRGNYAKSSIKIVYNLYMSFKLEILKVLFFFVNVKNHNIQQKGS